MEKQVPVTIGYWAGWTQDHSGRGGEEESVHPGPEMDLGHPSHILYIVLTKLSELRHSLLLFTENFSLEF
jgi:hypothetical protein